MKTSQEFIDEVKTKAGDQVTRDGRLIRDLDDKELMKKMLERYPGERENIADIDEYLGEEAQNLPDTPAKSDVQEQLDKVTKSPGFLERVKNRAVNTYENVKSEIQRTGENEGQSALRSGFDAVAGVATSIPGFAKEALPEFARDAVDYVGEKGGELYNKAVVEPLANTDLIKGAAEGYNAAERGEVELSPLASALPDALGIAGSAGEIAGSILGAKGVFDAGKGTFNTAKNAPTKIDAALEPRRQAKIESRKAEVDDAVKRIIQGAPEDVDAAKRALTSIDTTGVKTYKELKDVMKDDVATLSEKLDTLLDTEAPTPLKADQLSQYIKVGDKTIAQSPVQTALKELGDYYNKINDAASAEKIRQTTEKLDTTGLTLKEVNDIAKLHGRDLNAFNANGELASGLSKQAAENTRKGLKTVVRDRTTGDAAKAIDSQISDLLQTSKLVDDMEVKVQKLYQKIKKRTLAAKVGGAAADVLDLATMGTLRGFVAKLFPSNVGLKTANSLDLEKELSKNLKKIDELTAIEDPKKFSDAMSTYMEEIQPGLSTRLVSGLTAPEKDVLLKKLMSTDSKSVMKKDQADLELFDRLETMKETADKRPLTEREFVELRTLMDEVPESFNQGATPATTDLVQEAKKYKSAEEFVENQMARGGGMQHRPTFTKATAADVSQKASDFGMPDFYNNPQMYRTGNVKADNESIQALLKVRNKPDAEITIYRASPKNELREGDWVTLSKEYAQGESLAESTKVNSFKVKARDIQFAGDSINEFGYFPSSKVDELSEVWRKATNNGVDVKDEFLVYLEKNLEKYKTKDDWVNAMKASSKTRTQLEDIWKQANQQ